MFEFLENIYEGLDYSKFMRLVIVIGGYVLIRNLIQRELAKRKLANQIREDKDSKMAANTNKFLEDPEKEEEQKKIEEEAVTSTFGWGKKTRLRVNRQQQALEKAVERLQEQEQNGTLDEDADIQDLLED